MEDEKTIIAIILIVVIPLIMLLAYRYFDNYRGSTWTGGPATQGCGIVIIIYIVLAVVSLIGLFAT